MSSWSSWKQIVPGYSGKRRYGQARTGPSRVVDHDNTEVLCPNCGKSGWTAPVVKVTKPDGTTVLRRIAYCAQYYRKGAVFCPSWIFSEETASV